jgi:hypothetical protein
LSPIEPRNKDLRVGDLVTHALYGKEWIGVVVGFEEDENAKGLSKRKALVQLQPGTKHDGFFNNRAIHNRIHKNLGYVSIHWLFKLEISDGDTGPSRDKTSPS